MANDRTEIIIASAEKEIAQAVSELLYLERFSLVTTELSPELIELAIHRQAPLIILIDPINEQLSQQLRNEIATADIAQLCLITTPINLKQNLIDGLLNWPAKPAELITLVRLLLRVHQAERSMRADNRSHQILPPIPNPAGGKLKESAANKEMTDSGTELREDEELFRQLAENIRDALWVSGPLGSRMTYVNPAYEEIWGYSRQSLYEQSKTFLNSIYPADRPRVIAAFKRLLRQDSNQDSKYDEQYRIVRSDGSLRWIHDRAFPVRNSNGDVYRIVGIAEDITERKQIEEQLLSSQEQLRALSARFHKLQEEERTWLAREIHDEFGQLLTAFKIDLYWLRQRLQPEQSNLSDKIVAMVQLVDSMIITVRRISTDLRPRLLDDLGLAAATEWAVKEFQTRTEIDYDLTIEPEDLYLPPDYATAVYRILQEALTNVARHANASSIIIKLIKSSTELLLEVRDNGRGITEAEIKNSNSLGLMGIKERAFLWSGNVQISGEPQQGTMLSVKIPLPPRFEGQKTDD